MVSTCFYGPRGSSQYALTSLFAITAAGVVFTTVEFLPRSGSSADGFFSTEKRRANLPRKQLTAHVSPEGGEGGWQGGEREIQRSVLSRRAETKSAEPKTRTSCGA